LFRSRLGLKNVLALTGDHPWCSPHWRPANPVHDLDFLKEVNTFGVPVVIGLFPIKSYEVANGFNTMVSCPTYD